MAVVGRPNVGKSTLVNRIVGRRHAIVEEKPGVTRDRNILDAEWSGHAFRLVDTGGWSRAGASTTGASTTGASRAGAARAGAVSGTSAAWEATLAEQISKQAERAMREADLIVLVVDATVGVTEEDAAVARVLRRAASPVLVVANKVDDERREPDAWAFAKLGLGDPFPVSALHGRGSGDFLDALVARLPEASGRGEEAGPHVFAVAIVGRPNVGKSTLFNRLVGDERAVVHDLPGTTRDSVDTIVETDEGPIRFVDTAGMRRRSRIVEPTEYYSLVRALDAVDRADAALLVIDASDGVTHQDQRLAERLDAAGNAVVVVLNKWDLVTDPDARARVTADVTDRLGFLGYAPVLKVSARTGRGLHRILPALRQAEDAYHRRIPTAELNRVLQAAQAHHPPPPARGHRPRILYGTQGATDPPTFTLFATHEVPPTYLRYLERRIREAFQLGPAPIKLRVRRRAS